MTAGTDAHAGYFNPQYLELTISMNAIVHAFLHEPSSTFSYVVRDPESRAAAVIDPVMNFEYRSGRMDTAPADRLIEFCRKRQLELQWILETHAHADHVSAAAYLQDELGSRTAISDGIRDIQANFARVFNLADDFTPDGSQFDRLLADGDRFAIGSLEGTVMETPGHTSDSVSYRIGDAVFVGDTLFMPDYGSARCDFPGGDAGELFDSIRKLYALPDTTRMFLCHDYPPDGRAHRHETTVGEQKRSNLHIRADTRREDFVRMRNERDAVLPLPELIIPAVQLNINGGRPYPPESNGIAYLKIPLNVFPDKRR